MTRIVTSYQLEQSQPTQQPKCIDSKVCGCSGSEIVCEEATNENGLNSQKTIGSSFNSEIECEDDIDVNSPDSPITARRKSRVSEGKSTFSTRQPIKEYEDQLKKDKTYQALIEWFSFDTEAQKLLESLIKRCYNEYGRGFKDTNVLLKAIHQLEDGLPLTSLTIDESDLIQHDSEKEKPTKIDLPLQSESAESRPSIDQPVSSGEIKTSTKSESPKAASSTASTSQRRKAEFTCKVCLDEPVSVTFVPCGHLVACVSCASALFECPVCRASIRGTIKTFF